MKVEVSAEYACGHAPRVVVSGEVRRGNLAEDIAGVVDAAMPGGEVVFNCPCGRGAAFVEIRVDGQLVSRTPASAFVGRPGARLTARPTKGETR